MKEPEAPALREAVLAAVRRVLVGQDRVVEEVLAALLVEGHVLLEGVPGTAKTTLVRALARLLRLQFGRIQFTPDLMPADILGTHIYSSRTEAFRLVRGPVFVQLLLADEINRAPAKTQAALLEAMQERQVTIEGETVRLPEPFLVCATQNPVEHEGTYPLPPAELDRFLVKVLVDYPAPEEEAAMLALHRGDEASLRELLEALEPVADAQTLRRLKEEALAVVVRPEVARYIVDLVGRTRAAPEVLLGASPRAALGLLAAAKAWALLEGRAFVIPDDVKRMAPPVLAHRLLLSPAAEVEGVGARTLVERLLEETPVPR